MVVWFHIRPQPGWWWREAGATWTRPLFAQNRYSSSRSSIKSQICTRPRPELISQPMTKPFPQGSSMVLTFLTSHPSWTLEKEKEWTHSRKEEWKTTRGRLGYWSKSNVCVASFRINLLQSWRCPKTLAIDNSSLNRLMASYTAKPLICPCCHSNSCNHRLLQLRIKRIWPLRPHNSELRYRNSLSAKHWNQSWSRGCRARRSRAKAATDQRLCSCRTLEENSLRPGSVALILSQERA